MKRITHTNRAHDKLLHIETDLGIINIHVGLYDSEGRRVERIEVIPDKYTNHPAVTWDGSRLIETGVAL